MFGAFMKPLLYGIFGEKPANALLVYDAAEGVKGFRQGSRLEGGIPRHAPIGKIELSSVCHSFPYFCFQEVMTRS